MRIDKYISSCKDISRRDVKKFIKQGLVTVNGEVCSRAEEQVDGESIVTLCGEKLYYREFVYLMLNKPAGYVSAVFDKKYPAVTELVDKEYAHFGVFPVGRLDINTEGFLILTNDGMFTHDMTSPKKNVYKRYFAVLDKPMDESDIAEFEKGMELGDFTAKSARVEICENPCEVYIEIAEGKFHQVKRMCAKVGKNVTYLKRVAIGKVALDEELEPGEIRELTKDELEALKN